MAFCMPCNRVFKDDGALSMHLQSNRTHQEPAVVSIQKCVRCDLDFNGPGELALHVLVSERHFVCMECVADGEWQDFLTKRALKNHAWAKHRVDAGRGDGEKSDEKKKNSKGKKKGKAKETTPSVTAERETPLDEFFTSFAGFKYDPRLSPEASWKLLQAFKGWENRSKLYGPKSDAWAQYQKALVREVEMWFGDETDLTAWRTLCKAVGCFDPPDDIRKCKAILRNTHVNIVDLIDWGRRGGGEREGNKVTVFKSVEALREYTRKTGKVFSQRELEQYEGGNVVLRHLLRRLFS